MKKIENKQILPEFGNVLKTPVEDAYHGVLPVEEPVVPVEDPVDLGKPDPQ